MSFDQLEILVLDEADRMLDMGFIHDIRKVLRLLPKQRQTLMFSATFSNEIRTLAKTLVRSPKEIDISPRNSTAERVRQWVVTVDKRHKAALLTHLIGEQQWFQVLVFTRTKHGANRLAKQLESAGIEAVAIHGNKSQNARTRALAGFKSGDVRALVATDIAARGLDIDQLPQVVNFDLPNVAEDYVHRIGRTGRAGADGEAVSLVSGEDQKLLKGIERLIKQPIERRQVTNFEPPAVADIPDEREPRSRPNGSRSGSRSGPRSDGASPNKSGQRRSAPRGADGKPAPRRRRRGGGGGGGGQRSGNGGNRASRG